MMKAAGKSLRVLMAKSAIAGGYGLAVLHRSCFSRSHRGVAQTFPSRILKTYSMERSLLFVTDIVPINQWRINCPSLFWLFSGHMFVVISWMQAESFQTWKTGRCPGLRRSESLSCETRTASAQCAGSCQNTSLDPHPLHQHSLASTACGPSLSHLSHCASVGIRRYRDPNQLRIWARSHFWLPSALHDL